MNKNLEKKCESMCPEDVGAMYVGVSRSTYDKSILINTFLTINEQVRSRNLYERLKIRGVIKEVALKHKLSSAWVKGFLEFYDKNVIPINEVMEAYHETIFELMGRGLIEQDRKELMWTLESVGDVINSLDPEIKDQYKIGLEAIKYGVIKDERTSSSDASLLLAHFERNYCGLGKIEKKPKTVMLKPKKNR